MRLAKARATSPVPVAISTISRGAAIAHGFDKRPEPQSVEAEGHGTVHKIIRRGNYIEHCLYLFGFGSVVAVGVDTFYVQDSLVI